MTKVSVKKSNKRLDNILSRYDINVFPNSVKQELNAAMNHPSFDPDKLADALEKAQARANQTTSPPPQTQQPTNEKLSFMDIVQGVTRLIGILFLCFAFYNLALIVVGVLSFAMLSITGDIGSAMLEDILAIVSQHAEVVRIALIIAYVLGFCWFVYKAITQIAQNIINSVTR